MRSLSRAEQKAMDRAAAEAGLPTLLLMEEAGRAVYEAIRDLLRRRTAAFRHAREESPFSGKAAAFEDSRVDLFCGPGNNGGDAYVTARLLLSEGFRRVCVWELDPDRAAKQTGDAGVMRGAYLAMGGVCRPAEAYLEERSAARRGSGKGIAADLGGERGKSIAVDALLGTGFRSGRPLTGLLRELCLCLNQERREGKIYTLSVDLPSGLDADSGLCDTAAVEADLSVSFVYPKAGMLTWPGCGHSAELRIAPIGFSPAFLETFFREQEVERRRVAPQPWPSPVLTDTAWLRERAPVIDADAHKGRFGRALMICGSPGMLGAALLAAEAALRSGVGLLHALVPKSLYPSCVSRLPSVLWKVMPETWASAAEGEAGLSAALAALMTGMNAVLIGSGLGNMDGRFIRAAIQAALAQDTALILDADALNAIASEPAAYAKTFRARADRGARPPIMTPHPGEFARLAPDLQGADMGRLEQARRFASRAAVTLVLKGAATLSAFPDGRVFANGSGNPGMAQGGSGDALAGLLLGLSAQKLPDDLAVPAAVHLHGLAGDLAAARLGYRALTTPDLIAAFPAAFHACGWDPGYVEGGARR